MILSLCYCSPGCNAQRWLPIIDIIEQGAVVIDNGYACASR